MSEQVAGEAASQRRLRDIVKSTAIVGIGSVVTVLCGIVRGKVISLIAGPAGIGLQGLLQSTMRTSSSIAAMSLSTSGVREVARLRGEDNTEELGHTLRALWWTTALFGALAAIVLAAFQRPLARALIDDTSFGWMIAVVGLGVCAQVLYCVYDAFLRGSRRIALVTKASMAANVLATGTGAALVAVLGQSGIVWALIAQPVFILASAAIAGRDITSYRALTDRRRTRRAASRIVRMGIVLTITGFISTGVQLGARVLVERSTSLDDVGYFQAAWAVSVLYLGFVLQALGLDYYPRLAAVGSNRPLLNQMVNEQARISFLLSGPAILGLLTLSGPIIHLLYSPRFAMSAEILRWQLLGDVLKIGSWTLSYLVLAQGRSRAYFFTELSWNVVYLAVLAIALPSLGVKATAAAYVSACAAYFVVLYVVSNRFAGFTWTRNNIGLMSEIAALTAVVMAGHLFLRGWWSLVVGCVATAGFGIYCLSRLVREAGIKRFLKRSKVSS